MKNELLNNRREKLMKDVKENSIVILFAGQAPKKSADERYAFTPNRNFYYFTGLHEENHILLLSNIKGYEEILFIKEVDEEKEKWEGKTIRKDGVLDVTGIKEVKFLGDLEVFLNRLFKFNSEVNVYLDLEIDNINSYMLEAEVFSNKIRKKYPQVNIKNIYPNIISHRLVKDKYEIEQIQKAIDITVEGVNSMMKNVKAGMKEYELEAYFEFECKSRGVKDYAFKTIAATGKNATILHYVDNNSELKNNELILFDLGAQYNYYNGDISRTFPVNGKFTERQKAVYESVLKVNKDIISMIKPGIKFIDINNKANDLIAEECIKLGLIKDKGEFRKYYWHSIGHSLGLDTHDMDYPSRDAVLEPGMVYTVEPGIYIEEESIGIRIEDDILVTEDGNEVLTKNMIKEVTDIEKYMEK
ncbi:MAG: aminopeptidase P family protein [Clostridium sp.]